MCQTTSLLSHLFDDPVWPVYGEKQPLLEEALLHVARAVHELQHGRLCVRPDVLPVLGVEVVLFDEDTQTVLKYTAWCVSSMSTTFRRDTIQKIGEMRADC